MGEWELGQTNVLLAQNSKNNPHFVLQKDRVYITTVVQEAISCYLRLMFSKQRLQNTSSTKPF